jgi:hypothetical protein
MKSVSVKGGGQPSAALAVGSRAVGKRKTLYASLSYFLNSNEVEGGTKEGSK